MDTVTYPDAAVIAAVGTGFVPFKINMLERHPDFREACAGGRVLWGPTHIVADARGREVRRWVGWLPPHDFLAELAFVQALAGFNNGDFVGALAGFDAVVANERAIAIRPEALYWQGIAGFLAGSKDMEALRRAWERVVAGYPGTRWAAHAAVIEDAPRE